jgi:hypothetical protein
MTESGQGSRCNEDGKTAIVPEQRASHIHALYIPKYAWSKSDARPIIEVEAMGEQIFGSRRVVGPCALSDNGSGSPLEVIEVEAERNGDDLWGRFVFRSGFDLLGGCGDGCWVDLAQMLFYATPIRYTGWHYWRGIYLWEVLSRLFQVDG